MPGIGAIQLANIRSQPTGKLRVRAQDEPGRLHVIEGSPTGTENDRSDRRAEREDHDHELAIMEEFRRGRQSIEEVDPPILVPLFWGIWVFASRHRIGV